MHETNRLLDLRHENTEVEITEVLHTNEEFGYFMPCNIVLAKNEIVCLTVVKYSSLFESETNLFEECQKMQFNFMKHLVECDI